MRRDHALLQMALWPTLTFGVLFTLGHYGGLDEWLAARFFDPAINAFPWKERFLTSEILHHDAQRAMTLVLVAVIVTWLLSFRVTVIRRWRPVLGYFLAASVLSVLTVSLLKETTNMDCPWSLLEFGGQRPHVSLFSTRPASLPPGHCFPGGHSSSGFGLFALYFVARRLNWRRQWLALAPALFLGSVFMVTQWMRGAHFFSHDVTTAYLCWMIALGSYILAFQFPRKTQRPIRA